MYPYHKIILLLFIRHVTKYIPHIPEKGILEKKFYLSLKAVKFDKIELIKGR